MWMGDKTWDGSCLKSICMWEVLYWSHNQHKSFSFWLMRVWLDYNKRLLQILKLVMTNAVAFVFCFLFCHFMLFKCKWAGAGNKLNRNSESWYSLLLHKAILIINHVAVVFTELFTWSTAAIIFKLNFMPFLIRIGVGFKLQSIIPTESHKHICTGLELLLFKILL